ncbi:MAG: hypothetical protein QNJ46_26275 [Leptolyngbyaceae cyanobacterium MO_188.B28]|nr:hypothetical protein [Leptolyngbyaceae cyanobacterium MO_188.B28]
MLNLSDNALNAASIESIVRTALSLGELFPGAEAQIERNLQHDNLSATDYRMLAILKDAIADGCVRRIGLI